MLAGKFSKLSLEKQIQILDMLNMYYDEKVKNTTISDEKKVKLQDKIEVLKNIMLSVQ
jgi:hypothetical protein